MNLFKSLMLASVFFSPFSVMAQDLAHNSLVIKNESSLGMTSFKSAQSQALDTELFFGKHLSEAQKGNNKYSLFGNYFYGKTGNELTARSWMGGFRYDRFINPDLSFFAAETLDGNRFLSFVLRSNTDIGSKYYWSAKNDDKDATFALIEGGYRITYEDRTSQPGSTFSANSTSHKVRIYSFNSYAWTANFATTFGVEYLKTLGNDNRDQMNAELAAINKLSEILSFKASYLVNYDDTLKEQGFESNSSRTLAVSLIANY